MAKAGNKNEDFLLWDKDITDKYRKYNSEENTIKACLQFFGGLSKWNIDLFREVTSEEKFGLETLMSLKRCVYGLRNDTFHFATNNKDSSWNTKLMLNNILLRHNVIIETEFGTGIKEMDNGTKKNCAEIKVKSIKSDMFTYKLDAGKELKIAAKDDTYLKNILALLNYPKHTDENIVITYKDKVIKKAEHNNKNESNKSKKNFGKKDNEYVYSDKSSGYFPFKNIRLN